jgi:hypothetical protein
MSESCSLRGFRAFAYAIFILLGYIAITPGGIIPISARGIIGVIGIFIGIFGLIIDVGMVGQEVVAR